MKKKAGLPQQARKRRLIEVPISNRNPVAIRYTARPNFIQGVTDVQKYCYC